MIAPENLPGRNPEIEINQGSNGFDRDEVVHFGWGKQMW